VRLGICRTVLQNSGTQQNTDIKFHRAKRDFIQAANSFIFCGKFIHDAWQKFLSLSNTFFARYYKTLMTTPPSYPHVHQILLFVHDSFINDLMMIQLTQKHDSAHCSVSSCKTGHILMFVNNDVICLARSSNVRA
jgi:hypothetical protein